MTNSIFNNKTSKAFLVVGSLSGTITMLSVVGLLVLDWLAFDDITTGNEPSYLGEWAIIAFSVMVFGVILVRVVRKRN